MILICLSGWNSKPISLNRVRLKTLPRPCTIASRLLLTDYSVVSTRTFWGNTTFAQNCLDEGKAGDWCG